MVFLFELDFLLLQSYFFNKFVFKIAILLMLLKNIRSFIAFLIFLGKK